jgi:hypothetical protein
MKRVRFCPARKRLPNGARPIFFGPLRKNKLASTSTTVLAPGSMTKQYAPVTLGLFMRERTLERRRPMEEAFQARIL